MQIDPGSMFLELAYLFQDMHDISERIQSINFNVESSGGDPDVVH